MTKKIALTIAGSDPSSGAGIQADLKSFMFLNVHGTSVVTCLTAQNTQHVRHVFPVPVKTIEQQIDTVFEDIPVHAIKTGMLYDADIIRCVSHKMKQYKMKPVVDPVMVSTTGDQLSTTTYADAIKKMLLPQTILLTANIPEAEALLGNRIRSEKDMEQACKKLKELGPHYILLKGGHLDTDDATDIVYNGAHLTRYSLPRIPQKNVHGTGCTLSALITGYLASGESIDESVRKAKFVLWNMIHQGYNIGHGATVLLHTPTVSQTLVPEFSSRDHFCVWLEVHTAAHQMLSFVPTRFIPEVGMNLGYALPYATKHSEICAIDGRISKAHTGAVCNGQVGFGVSKHIATVILTVMSFDPTFRSAVNVKYSEQTVEACKKVGLTVGCFDRSQEPSSYHSTMEWGTRHVITALHCIPDIIYDTGGQGKEPMIRLLGRTPSDVVCKLQRIIEKHSEASGKDSKLL